MSLNKDEALRAKDMAEDLMGKTDFTGARKLALRAQKLDSNLENISQMIMLCDVHCAATEKLTGNEMDWYGILQVEQNANDIMIKKQYRKLALVLHPDKNKLPGAESAFKLIGEAQRILLDKEKRMLHDVKRRTCGKPTQARAPAASYYTRPVSQTVDNMRNVFNGFRPENHHHQQKAQAQPATFVPSPSFWTSCPFCKIRYQYLWQHLNKEMTCQSCSKHFIAYEVGPFQDAPPAKGSCQATFCFPRQHKFPGQEAFCGGIKHPNNPATVSSRKNSSTMPTSAADNMSQDTFGKVGAENTNGKRKRKMVVESSESSDSESANSESSSESEDIVIDENNDTSAAQDLGSSRGKQPRRSVRNKRPVTYKENLSDDDVDPVNHSEEESAENIDTKRKKRTGVAKQSCEDHQSTETLRNGRNLKQKIKEDEVGSSDDASDSEEDAASENLINYDDPDFNDFDELRKEDRFQAGQIWALYDDDGMPRFYAIIRKVTTPVFKLKYQWLEAEEHEENKNRNLPVSVGQFVLGGEMNTNVLNTFSDMIFSETKSRSRKFKVYPRKGETWALFKNWNTYVSSDSDSPHKYEYEFVEILSDHEEEDTISVGLLLKVKGFTCVFCRMPKDGSNTFEIEPNEFCRFSHRIPSKRLTGTEGRGVAEGWYELDPAALPQNIEEIVVPTSPDLHGD